MNKLEPADVISFDYCMPSCEKYADVAELADAIDLGSSGIPRAGSIPVIRTFRSRRLLV